LEVGGVARERGPSPFWYPGRGVFRGRETVSADTGVLDIEVVPNPPPRRIMKLKVLFLTLFVAGVVASMAVAKPPPGHGKPNGRNADAGSTDAASTSTSTTATLPSSGKVVLCHRTGSKNHPWVRVSVNVHAARQRMAKGDKPAAADGSCGSTTVTTTTGTTTTDTTTTAATTTAATTTTSTP
jgi:hypothetical protein